MTVLWAGLGTGAVYAIVAIGFNIVLSAGGVFNFAAPQFLLVGAMLAYEGLSVHSVSFALVLLVCALIGGLIGYAEERIAIRPLPPGGHGALVTTVGTAVVLQGVALLVLGSQPESVPFPFGEHTYSFLGGDLGLLDLTLIVIAVVFGLSLQYVSHKTTWGIAGRASTSDADAATLRGINVRGVRAGAFALSGATLTLLGTFVGMKIGLSTDLGNDLVIIGFVAFALGGFGSYVGALLGGLIVGIFELETARYMGTDWSDIVLYGVLLGVLLIRPTGLFGHAGLRSV